MQSWPGGVRCSGDRCGQVRRGTDRLGRAWNGSAGQSMGFTFSFLNEAEPSLLRSGQVRRGADWSGVAWQSKAWRFMPRKRQPKEIWDATRKKIWLRDKGRCQSPYCTDKPEWSLPLNECHIDHIHSGKLGTNETTNLRVLCRRCHVLRIDARHRGMIAKALKDGIIPPNWRELLWEG